MILSHPLAEALAYGTLEPLSSLVNSLALASALSRTRSHPVGVVKISTYGLVVVVGLPADVCGVGVGVAFVALVLATGEAVGLVVAFGVGVGVAFLADGVAIVAAAVATGSGVATGAFSLASLPVMMVRTPLTSFTVRVSSRYPGAWRITL